MPSTHLHPYPFSNALQGILPCKCVNPISPPQCSKAHALYAFVACDAIH